MPPVRRVRRWVCCCTGLARSRCAVSVCCAHWVLQWLVPEPEEKPQAGQAQPQQYSAAATRLEQVSQSLASLAETVNDVYETLPHRREDFHWVIDNTHDTLCFNCGRRDTCWKQEYAATLEGMEALRPLLESSGGLETAQLPGQLLSLINI